MRGQAALRASRARGDPRHIGVKQKNKFTKMQTRLDQSHKELDDRITNNHRDLDTRIATAAQRADARLKVMEHRLNHAEGLLRAGGGPAALSSTGPDMRSREVVVIGGWEEDTDPTRMKEEGMCWLAENGVVYDRLYALAPRHRVMKCVFKDCTAAWAFLDAQPQWQGHWFGIERTRDESARQRPVFMAVDTTNELADAAVKVQHDVNRGIVWANGVRVAVRNNDDIIEWHENVFFEVTKARERHARLLARSRSM